MAEVAARQCRRVLAHSAVAVIVDSNGECNESASSENVHRSGGQIELEAIWVQSLGRKAGLLLNRIFEQEISYDDALTRRVLCLTRAQGFQTPAPGVSRLVMGADRRPGASGGQGGDWLLEMARPGCGPDRMQRSRSIHRRIPLSLATGAVVALDQPLAGDAATEVADSQQWLHERYRSLDEALLEEMGSCCIASTPISRLRVDQVPVCAGRISSRLTGVAWCADAMPVLT